MPPQAVSEAHVAKSAEAAAEALAEVPPAAALLDVAAEVEELEELELLQAAASKIDPTAATAATIALDARNETLPFQPARVNLGAGVCILARQVGILTNHPERKVAAPLTGGVRRVAICHGVSRCGTRLARACRAWPAPRERRPLTRGTGRLGRRRGSSARASVTQCDGFGRRRPPPAAAAT